MRTIFTTYDAKEVIKNIFNGGEYSEKIVLKDLEDNKTEEVDLAEYLNIDFYAWKNRVVSHESGDGVHDTVLSAFDAWVESMNYSFDKSFGLVEQIDEEVTATQDLDNAIKTYRVTFLIQADKIMNLEYYVEKIKNKTMGVPQDIINASGDTLKTYILVGSLIYDEEPTTIQFGECITASCIVRISYFADAESYHDSKIELSLDGDVDDGYMTMPFIKITSQAIFNSNPVPTQARPDLAGFVAASQTSTLVISFYDLMNERLSQRLNELHWSSGAVKIDGVEVPKKDVNIPVFVRVTNGGHTYTYKMVITRLDKVISSGTFNISSISLNTWGKIPRQI